MGHEIIQAITATILISLASLGAGLWISPLFPRRVPSFSWYICCWIGGFGILGLVLFVVGQWSFSKLTIGTVLAAGMTTALIHLWRMRGTFSSLLASLPKPPALSALIVLAVLAITTLGGLAEPVGDWGKDGVAYHLAGPKVWLREGIVRPIPDNAPTSYPSTAEMVFASLMAFGGQRAPGFSAVFTFALFILLVGDSGAW
jgi:hypothetical protein